MFKLNDQTLYKDEANKYEYFNIHSVKVCKGDYFVYLDKRKKYAFTAVGKISSVPPPGDPNAEHLARSPTAKKVYNAWLDEVIEFAKPLSIKNTTKEGKRNRALLGIKDMNKEGLSISVASIRESLFEAILELADRNDLIPPIPSSKEGFFIGDEWGVTKKRPYMKAFSNQVKQRSNNQCIACGSKLKGLMEAAHLSAYADDKENRANPANGVCLCRYCHRAMDLSFIAIMPNGNLLVNPEMKEDPVADFHFNQISAEKRKEWLIGVSEEFLNEVVERWRAVNR